MDDIKSLTLEELKEKIKSLGEPEYRAGQIFSWLHEKCVEDFLDMTNISGKLKDLLRETFSINTHKIKRVQTSKDGTQKFLFELSDGNYIESVLMEYDYGYSICVSTQVGCQMGCVFCASGMDGFVRNLSAAEIIEEVYSVVRFSQKRISRIVFMGMGEPLLNYENLLKAIRILSHEKGQDISPRHITLSTCGIIPGIQKLADENIPITLALSLHASTQEKREKIMPISKKYPLADVVGACKDYRKKTGRRITYEYCLIKDVNDKDEDVNELCSLLKNQDAHLNIIPVHEVEGTNMKKSDAKEFKKKLEKKGVNVTIRRELGQDIDGACGQLRMKT